jgi:hypothetical protein
MEEDVAHEYLAIQESEANDLAGVAMFGKCHILVENYFCYLDIQEEYECFGDVADVREQCRFFEGCCRFSMDGDHTKQKCCQRWHSWLLCEVS